MTKEQIYALGWVYGTITGAVPETKGDFQLSAMRPFTALAQAISRVHILHKSTKQLDRKIGEGLAIVDEMPDISGAEPVQPLEMQSEWQRGYYAARAGRLLDGSYDIAGRRQRAGMTQAQLAKALGVTQAFVSSMESGTKKVPEDMEARLQEILK